LQSNDLHSSHREYQAQFFINKLHGKIDYARFLKIGIKTIIYRVFWDNKQKGGLYFNNTQFRVIEPALENMIDDIVKMKSPINLCAWMIGRKFKWVTDSEILDYQYENYQRQLVPKLDIFNPGVMQKLINVYMELASKKTDSILIQDDLTLRYNEGFSNWGKAKFSGEANAPAREKLMMKKDSPYNKKWNQIKVKQISKVLKTIIRACKKVNSGLKVGMNIYYETPISNRKSEAWYAHNLKKILETGIDNIYLMSYHRQIKNEMKLSEAANRELFKKIVQNAYDVCGDKLIVKIQLRDWQTGERIPEEEIKAYLALVPPQIKRVCFTPVKLEDYQYLENIITNRK
jgi:biofilm PGA synthesis lipoprotein PgaB